MAKVINCIYIGDHFYRESRTIICPVQKEEGGDFDYGLIKAALEQGHTVHIRPANDKELLNHYKRLTELKEGFK